MMLFEVTSQGSDGRVGSCHHSLSRRRGVCLREKSSLCISHVDFELLEEFE